VRPGTDEVLDGVWEGADEEIKEANEGKGEELSESTVFHAEKWDEPEDLQHALEQQQLTGHEVWLDCLVTALEKEMADDEYLVAEVLRTKDMLDSNHEKAASVDQKPLIEFYERSGKVLRILEHKAMKKYYDSLKAESEERQDELRKQNAILYEYVCELEEEFEKVIEQTAAYRERKTGMLSSFGLALDRDEYAHLAKFAPGDEETTALGGGFMQTVQAQFKRFTGGWSGETISKKEAEELDAAETPRTPRSRLQQQ